MFARGSRHDLAYIMETVWGTTPGTPSMKRLRHTGTTLELQKQSEASEEIRSDRQIVDFRHGTRQVQGDVSFELSYGAFDDLLEAALFGAWTSDVLKAGTAVKSFTAERRHTDINQFLRFTGCMVNTFALTVQPSPAIVRGTFGIMGKDQAVAGTSLGTPSDVATHPPFDSFSGTLEEGGSAIAKVTGLELSLSNGIESAFAIGDMSAAGLLEGRSNLTGTLSAFFENASLISKFLDETESSLEVELVDPPGNKYTILVPRLKYSGGSAPVQGEGPIVLQMPFQALRDSTEGTNMVVTREAAS
jgi:hypothetical protein